MPVEVDLLEEWHARAWGTLMCQAVTWQVLNEDGPRYEVTPHGEDEKSVNLPQYAPWELSTQRKYMPVSLQLAIGAQNRAIRVDQKAYDKHTVGAHPESHGYLRELDDVLSQWDYVRPSPRVGNTWEVYIETNDPVTPWVLVVIGESRGGFNLVSIHLPRVGTVRNRLKRPEFQMNMKE